MVKNTPIPTISPEWQKVLDHYFSIPEPWRRELYLTTLNDSQKRYLMYLVKQIEGGIDKKIHENTHTSKPLTVTHQRVKKPFFGLFRRKKRSAGTSNVLSFGGLLMLGLIFGIGSFLIVSIVINRNAALAAFSRVPILDNFFENPEVESDRIRDEEFSQWIQNYPFSQENKQKNSDPDNDGLDNITEMLLGLNPEVRDENKNEKRDGVDVIQRINPLTGLSYNFSDQETYNRYNFAVNHYDIDFRITKSIIEERIIATNKDKSFSYNPSLTTVTEGNREDKVIDTSKLGKLEIQSLGLIYFFELSNIGNEDRFSSDANFSNFQHYPRTPYPGQTGISLIGLMLKNDSQYSNVLNELINLEPNTIIEVTLYTEDGDEVLLSFKSKTVDLVEVDDTSIFRSKAQQNLGITIPWPDQETQKKLFISAQLQEKS